MMLLGELIHLNLTNGHVTLFVDMKVPFRRPELVVYIQHVNAGCSCGVLKTKSRLIRLSF